MPLFGALRLAHPGRLIKIEFLELQKFNAQFKTVFRRTVARVRRLNSKSVFKIYIILKRISNVKVAAVRQTAVQVRR